ncbi:4362_t:CDS:2 [Cetraspora pellucida]|uniref:4362_t:CDS:1 n=1 Tax=Cetraspora pellucida TaxID=1433469 RepID=A0A9N8WJW7_9GLOM|nr:4362_t:CDS:2 [Cetraspora pellucida]
MKKFITLLIFLTFLSYRVDCSNFTFPTAIYGNLSTIKQYDDETLLITTQNITTDDFNRENNNIYLYLFFTNGSIIPVQYESISDCNGSNFLESFPLSTNYIFMTYQVNDMYRGVVIDWHGNFKSSLEFSSDKYALSIPIYNYLQKGFLIAKQDNKDSTNLTWTIYEFSNEEKITQGSNGTIYADDEYTISNFLGFNTIDGHYAVAYSVFNVKQLTNHDNSSYNSADPVMSIYVNIIKDGVYQQILIFQSYDKTLRSSKIVNCHSGYASRDIQSSICFISLVFHSRNDNPFNVIKFIKFSTSGSVIHTGTANTAYLKNNSRNVHSMITPLKYGGYLYYDEFNRSLGFICNNDKDCKSFEISADAQEHYLYNSSASYGVFSNNTVWITMDSISSPNWYIITKDADCLFENYGFNNLAVLSTQPEQNSTLTSLSTYENRNITITFFTPIALSTGKLTVFQVINESDYLLRQISPASDCNVMQATNTTSCNVLSSTFNRINSTYVITVDDNFVKTLSFDEPLTGIRRDIWRVKTPKYANRLYMTGNVQSDSSCSNILVEFSVIKATDFSNVPSVLDIINDLDDMIKNKDTSALSDKSYAKFLDSNYGFQPQVRVKLFAAIIAIILLLTIYLFAKRKYPESNNNFIFKIVLIIFDFILDILFVVKNGNDIKELFVPSEIQTNSEFRDWFVDNIQIGSICTLLSCPNVEALNILRSKIANLKLFAAPFSDKAEKRIYYGTIINMVIEDIPQFIVQVRTVRGWSISKEEFNQTENVTIVLKVLKDSLTIDSAFLRGKDRILTM